MRSGKAKEAVFLEHDEIDVLVKWLAELASSYAGKHRHEEAQECLDRAKKLSALRSPSFVDF